jgi:iron complex transport system ATP-binding protein
MIYNTLRYIHSNTTKTAKSAGKSGRSGFGDIMKDDEMLAAENVDFGYRDRKILSDISFSVKKGEICGLLGPNGSGKTTILKCINRILHCQAGAIRIRGRDVAGLSREEIAELVAMVPQELNIVFSFSVLEIVLMAGNTRFGISGIARKSDYAHAFETLEELHIGHLAERRYNELSGGEKQMVLMARALFQKAGLLLLDEPTSHLDFKRQYIIMELIRRITREKNLTTIMSLHDPNIAGRYCDRLIMLSGGRICRQGLRDKVFHVESLESLYDMKIRMGQVDTGASYVFPAYEQ